MALMLLKRDTIVLELGNEDGLVLCENVAPNGYGMIHIIVFNRRHLSNLEDILRAAARWAFSTFKLAYLAAWIPVHNAAALSLVQRLGWNLDGHLRGVMIYCGKRVDAAIYSISKEEALL